ncbi:MAG: hypothetical protein RLZZ410_1605 [Pseudomonadota bacterium]|jgi:hypothetical protein
MSSESYKSIFFILLAVLCYSIYSHYLTGKSYKETCYAVLSAVDDNETRFQQVLGKKLASECRDRMSSID